MTAYPNLPAPALFGLAQTNKIEAIKSLRASGVGYGLKEAKEAIDHALSIGQRRGIDFLTGVLAGPGAEIVRAAEIRQWGVGGDETVAQFVLRSKSLIIASGDGYDSVHLPADQLPQVIAALQTLLD